MTMVPSPCSLHHSGRQDTRPGPKKFMRIMTKGGWAEWRKDHEYDLTRLAPSTCTVDIDPMDMGHVMHRPQVSVKTMPMKTTKMAAPSPILNATRAKGIRPPGRSAPAR
jgi:hypothetical protein